MSDTIVLPAPAGLGHNQPPAPLSPEQVTAWLDDTQGGLLRRRDQLVAGVDAFLAKYPEIDDPDVNAAAIENLEMLRKLGIGKSTRAEAARVEAKEPYLEGGRAVDAWFKRFCETVAEAHARLRKPATAYAEKLEAANRARAQAEAHRLAQEAEAAAAMAARTSSPVAFDTAIRAADQADQAAKLAEARPAEHSRTVGTYGTSTGSLRESLDYEVIDESLLPREYLVRSDSAIRAAIRAGERLIPGLRIFAVRTLQTRSGS